MFTGIIEELGTVDSLKDQGDAIRLTVRGPLVTSDAGLGDSISVNGCCLTVSDLGEGRWTADLMQETLDKTSLRGVVPGDRVNLERAVTVDSQCGRRCANTGCCHSSARRLCETARSTLTCTA